MCKQWKFDVFFLLIHDSLITDFINSSVKHNIYLPILIYFSYNKKKSTIIVLYQNVPICYNIIFERKMCCVSLQNYTLNLVGFMNYKRLGNNALRSHGSHKRKYSSVYLYYRYNLLYE